MSKNTPPATAPIVTPATFTPEQFAAAYKDLCDKYGYSVQAYPVGAIVDGVFQYRSLEYKIVKIKDVPGSTLASRQ
jgi:hypothetical protein